MIKIDNPRYPFIRLEPTICKVCNKNTEINENQMCMICQDKHSVKEVKK